jgi:hypothetical protein
MKLRGCRPFLTPLHAKASQFPFLCRPYPTTDSRSSLSQALAVAVPHRSPSPRGVPYHGVDGCQGRSYQHLISQSQRIAEAAMQIVHVSLRDGASLSLAWS